MTLHSWGARSCGSVFCVGITTHSAPCIASGSITFSRSFFPPWACISLATGPEAEESIESQHFARKMEGALTSWAASAKIELRDMQCSLVHKVSTSTNIGREAGGGSSFKGRGARGVFGEGKGKTELPPLTPATTVNFNVRKSFEGGGGVTRQVAATGDRVGGRKASTVQPCVQVVPPPRRAV